MKRYRNGLFLVFTVLSACQMAGAPTFDDSNPYAPPLAGDTADSVDGLIVGHRLMAAGEYELALKAYLRAGGEQGLTADVYSALGSANLKLGRLGQAERLLRQAVGKDPEFVPAWNNLGVVLMEKNQWGEAKLVFQRAFALDSGQSDSIRQNLRRAIAKIDNPIYSQEKDYNFALMRRGSSEYLLLSAQ